MEKMFNLYFALTFLFAGILIGIFLSPVKRGIYCGNNNANTFFKKQEDLDDDWNDEYDDDGDVIRF